MRRRTFLGVISAGAAGVLTGGLQRILAAIPEASGSMSMSKTFLLGGDLLVNRLGFGAMRLTGEGIWVGRPFRFMHRKRLTMRMALRRHQFDFYFAPERSRGAVQCCERDCLLRLSYVTLTIS